MKRLAMLSLLFIIGCTYGQTKKKKSISKKVVPTTKINTIVEKNYEIIDPKNDNSTSPIGNDEIYYQKGDDNKIYNIAGIEVSPDFPGGNKELFSFISKNFQFTDEMKENKLKGKIIASFVVEKDGSISDIKVIRGLGFGTENEAIRVLKLMPKWKPGMQNGKKVRCANLIPITIYANN